jgi:LysR family nod box-dependent transcriptional activator
VCLKALLNAQNITRAAAQVHLRQSAMRTTLGHLRQHFQDSLLARPGRAHVLTTFAKSLIAPLNEMLGQANQFAALRSSNIQPDINREIRIVASDYTILACLDTTLRTVRGGFRNLRLDILPLWERAPQLLANGAVGLVRAGQSLDVGVPPQ